MAQNWCVSKVNILYFPAFFTWKTALIFIEIIMFSEIILHWGGDFSNNSKKFSETISRIIEIRFIFNLQTWILRIISIQPFIYVILHLLLNALLWKVFSPIWLFLVFILTSFYFRLLKLNHIANVLPNDITYFSIFLFFR